MSLLKSLNSLSRRLIFLLVAFLYCSPAIFAQQLSDQAKISILTCGQGEDLYAIFGHTAIRIVDPLNRFDKVYNYGTFDFSQSHFYLRFLMGNLEYALTVTDFDDFLEEYTSENRSIYEQVLTFDTGLLNRIYDSLEMNSLTENRGYLYDFFEDNCTTRVLGLLYAQAGDQGYDDLFNHPSGSTFRQELRQYIHHDPWLSLGINLLLGKQSDIKISNYQSYFLPANLMNGLAKTDWVGESKLLFQGKETFERPGDFAGPMVFFWLLLVLYVAEILLLKTTRQTSDRFDLFIFTVTGILGLLFLFLRLFSDHPSFQSNMNILWANPLNLIFVIALVSGWKKLATVYLVVYATLIFFCLVTWNRMPQQLPLDIMPLLALMAFRTVQRLFVFVKKPEKSLVS
ncbi:MAG: DUF4105 domain-containing protein [Bacteroidales bacterium]|nr:DUF4105 domain-containing protein [Bacteroidales bacterium]